MPYATETDLREAIGEAELLRIADRDHDGVHDAAAVASALAKASSVADSYLAHLLPLTAPYPEALVDAVIRIAVSRLAGSQVTETQRKDHDDALTWLRDVSRGRASLAAPDAKVDTPTAEVETEPSEGDWTGDKTTRIF
ncbi:MAG: DUF1320 family protein [Sandaracinaceae bacterium]